MPKLQEQKWTSLHSFTHTHTDTEAGIQFFPLGPLLLSPDISQRGFHVGSWNTRTAAFPHSSAMFFLLGSHPIAYGQLSPGPCPPLMPHKDSQENNPFCLFQSETNQDGDPCHSPLFSPLLLWPCPDPLTFLPFLSYNAEVPWHIKEHKHLQMMMGENNINLSLLVQTYNQNLLASPPV